MIREDGAAGEVEVSLDLDDDVEVVDVPRGLVEDAFLWVVPPVGGEDVGHDCHGLVGAMDVVPSA